MPKTDDPVKLINQNVEWLARLAEDAERRLDNANAAITKYVTSYGTPDAVTAYHELLQAQSGGFN